MPGTDQPAAPLDMRQRLDEVRQAVGMVDANPPLTDNDILAFCVAEIERLHEVRPAFFDPAAEDAAFQRRLAPIKEALALGEPYEEVGAEGYRTRSHGEEARRVRRFASYRRRGG